MRTNKKLFALSAGLAAGIVTVWFCTSIQGGHRHRSYEIRPEITLPEYRTDTARAIDAYERVMERYMDLNERNLAGINADVAEISVRLYSIDSRLTELSARMARIEKALGIEQPRQPVEPSLKMSGSDHAKEPQSENGK